MSIEPIIEWRWRIKWGGKWTTGKLWQTEAEARREHPEAVRVEGSKRVRATPAPIGTMYRPAEAMDPRIAPAWKMKRRPD